MYTTQEEKDAMMDSLFDLKIKGRVDSIWRLQKQLERCNMLLGMGDVMNFENGVLALKGDLPMGVKSAVLARGEEYNKTKIDWAYTQTCGHNVGTPDNPFVIVVGHPEWDFLKDIPRPFREKNSDKITIISPIKDEYQKTDYIDLFEVIKEELERASVTWQYDKKTYKSRKVREALPKYIISHIVKNRVELLIYLRKLYPQLELGLSDLNVGWDEHPPTPILNNDEEVEE